MIRAIFLGFSIAYKLLARVFPVAKILERSWINLTETFSDTSRYGCVKPTTILQFKETDHTMEIFLFLIVCAVPIILIWGSNTACVECNKWFGRTTISDEKLNVKKNETLVQGRITKRGYYDRRYNNTVRVRERGIRYRRFKCSSCGHLWEEKKPYDKSWNESR